MKPLYKGLLLAVLQMAIVCSLGAKLLYDRGHRPRVWIKVAAYDPNLPIRGRYLAFNLEVPAEGFSLRMEPSPWQKDNQGKPVMQEVGTPTNGDLVLRSQQLVVRANENGEYWVRVRQRDNTLWGTVSAQTIFFVPEHLPDPTRRPAGEELWIEATIPRKGPPRPIHLGVKKDGVIAPLVIY